jgi:DNA excision repair protein ERCC-3
MTDKVTEAISDLESTAESLSGDLASVQEALESEKSELKAKQETLQARNEELQSELQRVKSQIEQLSEQDIDTDRLQEFLEKPYTIVPKEENEVWVIVPRWVPFHVGILQKQDETYNHFVVNQYVNWIHEVPDEIKEKIGISGEFDSVSVDGSVLEFDSESEREYAWESLGGRDGGLYKRAGDTDIQIKSGSEFDVISELVERGNLPFKQTPIQTSDLRAEPKSVHLREYQERAWEKFKDTGMVGVYWPPGLGKTFFGLYSGERLSGKKLVVVPSTPLRDQWEDRIQEFTTNPSEWEVQTYQYLARGSNIKEYTNEGITLTIIDEAHYIPGNKFSKIATVDTRYRIGLSASPFREDDKTSYIFSLTGFPVGLNWEEYLKYDVLEYPDITVLLHRTQRQKQKTVEDLITETGKILIYCDSIDKGKQLSTQIGVPFVHGDSSEKLKQLQDNRVVISSRVGDEGVSLSDIETVIEYDFHGGSRRQEVQRVGRVMHGENGSGEHYVLMTDTEYEKFSNRLLALEEKGFDIRILRSS